jgi:hypothetical protein
VEDFGQELAVTKNDIKHLEADITEIKEGMKEGFDKIHTSIAAMNDKMDEKYVRKDEFKESQEQTSRKFDSINTRSNMILGAFLTLIVTIVANYFTHFIK